MTSSFVVEVDGKPLFTPAKHSLAVPTKALADAIAGEWAKAKKFSTSAMPLTSLAYTAIDYVAAQPDNVIETLLVYVDTDTLSYRATGSEKLAAKQKTHWDPVLKWAEKTYGATWETTTGVMPLEQPEALTNALRKRLQKLTNMQLAAACLLSSGFSSLVLMLAVIEKHLPVEEAFALSRLEEESQAEAWGRDTLADIRTARLKEDVLAVKRFLGLLEAA